MFFLKERSSGIGMFCFLKKYILFAIFLCTIWAWPKHKDLAYTNKKTPSLLDELHALSLCTFPISLSLVNVAPAGVSRAALHWHRSPISSVANPRRRLAMLPRRSRSTPSVRVSGLASTWTRFCLFVWCNARPGLSKKILVRCND